MQTSRAHQAASRADQRIDIGVPSGGVSRLPDIGQIWGVCPGWSPASIIVFASGPPQNRGSCKCPTEKQALDPRMETLHNCLRGNTRRAPRVRISCTTQCCGHRKCRCWLRLGPKLLRSPTKLGVLPSAEVLINSWIACLVGNAWGCRAGCDEKVPQS